MRTGDVGGGDAASGGEERLHLLGEEEGAGFRLDGVSGPERGAIAFLLPEALERKRGAADAEDVRQENGLKRIVWQITRQCELLTTMLTQNDRRSRTIICQLIERVAMNLNQTCVG